MLNIVCCKSSCTLFCHYLQYESSHRGSRCICMRGGASVYTAVRAPPQPFADSDVHPDSSLRIPAPLELNPARNILPFSNRGNKLCQENSSGLYSTSQRITGSILVTYKHIKKLHTLAKGNYDGTEQIPTSPPPLFFIISKDR